MVLRPPICNQYHYFELTKSKQNRKTENNSIAYLFVNLNKNLDSVDLDFKNEIRTAGLSNLEEKNFPKYASDNLDQNQNCYEIVCLRS